jgi:hypothetical protein
MMKPRAIQARRTRSHDDGAQDHKLHTGEQNQPSKVRVER